jgi:uncharacterized membrane protein YkvI
MIKDRGLDKAAHFIWGVLAGVIGLTVLLNMIHSGEHNIQANNILNSAIGLSVIIGILFILGMWVIIAMDDRQEKEETRQKEIDTLKAKIKELEEINK